VEATPRVSYTQSLIVAGGHGLMHLCLLEEDTGNTGQEDSEPKFVSKGTRRHHCSVVCSYRAPDPEPHHKDSVRTGAATTSDVAQKAVDGFGPLKATLGKLLAVCTDHKVRLPSLLVAFSFTDPSTGNFRSQK